MEQVTIRACVAQEINAVAELERQWERKQIAYGNFSPLGREGLLAALKRFLRIASDEQTWPARQRCEVS